MADAGRRGGHLLEHLLDGDFALGQLLAPLPDHRARAGQFAVVPTVEHRSAGLDDRRKVHRRRRHEAGRGGLVTTGRQHHAVERIAVQHLDQAKVGEVAVQRSGRAAATLLDRVHREHERDAARVADTGLDALGRLEVSAIARGNVAANLRDTNDRLAGPQFLRRDAVV